MGEDFYRAFEDKHRGSRELIKSRLDFYLQFTEPLKKIYQNGQAIDLGCGRGEWLEVLDDVGGFNAFGVDLDSGMLKVCKEYGLKSKQSDALEYLKGLADESQILVTGFHIAEHISFSDLQELVKNALRVLKPGGLLILETPNAENIVVGTNEFYMDPTHQQPIPAELLVFIADFYGFYRAKHVRLQENKHLLESKEIRLFDVFKGVSPDYAIIAQKNASKDIIDMFIDVFAEDYGISLETLSNLYEHQTIAKILQVEDKIQAAEAKIQAAEAKTQEAEARVYALLNSKTWRYTKFIRQSINALKQIIRRRKQVTVDLVSQTVIVINNYPWLKKFLLAIDKKINLRRHVRDFLSKNKELMAGNSKSKSRAQMIFEELKAEIDKNKGKN